MNILTVHRHFDLQFGLTHTHTHRFTWHTHGHLECVKKRSDCIVGDGKASLNACQVAILEAVRGRDSGEKERMRGRGDGTERSACVFMCLCVCVCSFQLGTFGHYQDESENRKGGSIKQDEGKTTTVPLPVSERGRKQQIF